MSSVAAASRLVETARSISNTVGAPSRTRSIAAHGFRMKRWPRYARAAPRPTRPWRAGATINDVASRVAIARSCASTAMITLCQIGSRAWCAGLASPLRDTQLARHEWLIASATSEQGVGGDLRRAVLS
jgi:acyl-CoA dehydrogenase